jgi:hypothetical protein
MEGQLRAEPSNVSFFCALTKADDRTSLKAGPALFYKYLTQKALRGRCRSRFRSENQILARQSDFAFFRFFSISSVSGSQRSGYGRAHAAASAAPGVSVVRPLCGLDNFCEETLQSSFELDYPSYEIIFCVARATDAAVPLVQPRLIPRSPPV